MKWTNHYRTCTKFVRLLCLTWLSGSQLTHLSASQLVDPLPQRAAGSVTWFTFALCVCMGASRKWVRSGGACASFIPFNKHSMTECDVWYEWAQTLRASNQTMNGICFIVKLYTGGEEFTDLWNKLFNRLAKFRSSFGHSLSVRLLFYRSHRIKVSSKFIIMHWFS